jgi:hypothetical protein
MNLSGEFAVRAPRDAVFNELRDPRFFASCFDGVSDLRQIDDSRYDATLETKVAFMKFRFKMTVEMVRIEAPDTIEATIVGAPSGFPGRLTATSITRLDEDGDTTRVRYDIDAALTGKLGSLGQTVMKAKAQEMERQFVARLRAAFEDAAPEESR